MSTKNTEHNNESGQIFASLAVTLGLVVTAVTGAIAAVNFF